MSLPYRIVGDPGSRLLGAVWDAKVRVIDVESRACVFSVETAAEVRTVRVNCQMGFVAVSFLEGGVACYALGDSRLLWNDEHLVNVRSLVNCGPLIGAVATHKVICLDAKDGRAVDSIEDVVVYFVDDGQQEFVAVDDGTAVRGVIGSKESQPLEWPSFSALHCSFQGERVAISAPDGLLAVYARESSQPVATWLDTSKVFNFPWIAFREDGSLLAVATGFMGKPEMCVVELDRDLKEIQLVQKLSPCAHVTSLDHSKYMVTLAGEIFHAEERGIVGKLDWTDYFS